MIEDSTIVKIISQKLGECDEAIGSVQARDRIKAMRYYLGEPFGNEVEGRSQVVSRDVAEAIDGMMPSLLRIFAGGHNTVRFDPRTKADEALAEQATDFVNWIWNSENRGFAIFYEWFKDALLYRLGVLKIWWDEAPLVKTETYQGLTDAELTNLLNQDGVVAVAHDSRPDPNPPAGMPLARLHQVTVRITKSSGRVRIETVPPEAFLVSAATVDLARADFIAHRLRRTAGDLLAMGFDSATIARLTSDSTAGLESLENQLRNQLNGGLGTGSAASSDDPAMRPITVVEAYLRIDCDGDGIAELRQITIAEGKGDSSSGWIILDNQPIDNHPFAVLTPVLMPHSLVGRSVADQTQDLQLLKSTLLRQMLDNLYLTNNPEKEVVEGQANLEDLLSSRPGGIKRVKQPNVIRMLETPFVAGASFPMLDYIDRDLEQRTGVTRLNQGLDPDAINRTATGASLLAHAGMQRVELIARVFAETGVRQAFRRILELVCKYQQKQQTIRLRDSWVDIDPRSWDGDWDMTVEVGIGTGSREQQVVQMMQLLQINSQVIAAQGGVNGPILDWSRLYDQLVKLGELMGIKNTESYFNNPETMMTAMPPQPMAPPLPSPAEVAMQLAQAKAANDIQIMQAKAAASNQIAAEKAMTEMQIAAAKAGQQTTEVRP
ncbi:MAG: hypothetical protein QM523_09455 [Candidatus Pacebacteria bacterium]|nr:hypothetical protein [Candidatus Paceibacterota bacterium]